MTLHDALKANERIEDKLMLAQLSDEERVGREEDAARRAGAAAAATPPSPTDSSNA